MNNDEIVIQIQTNYTLAHLRSEKKKRKLKSKLKVIYFLLLK